MWALLMNQIEQVIALMVAGIVEGTGIPWPGAVIMATTGITAGEDWRSVLLFVLVFSGAYTVGSLIQYMVGRVLGPAALGWLGPAQRAKLEAMVGRFGFRAVCLARPLAIGNYVSIPAGMLKMNPIRFALYTFVGAMPWAGGTILAGRFLGSQVAVLQAMLDRWMLPGIGILALALAGLVRTRRPRPGVLQSMDEAWARR